MIARLQPVQTKLNTSPFLLNVRSLNCISGRTKLVYTVLVSSTCTFAPKILLLTLHFKRDHSTTMPFTLLSQLPRGTGGGGACGTVGWTVSPVQQQHAGAWGVSRDDPFSVLLVNLQRDSSCSRGHLSPRSGLQAMSTAMRSTTELCMEAWLRTASVTPTQPLELGDNRKGPPSILYILDAYMCHFSSMLAQDSVLVQAARGDP